MRRHAGVGWMIASGGGGENLNGCDSEACNEAIRACGSGCSILAYRCEVSMYAMRLGADSSNASNFLNCSEICGVSLEGNIVGIEVVFEAETTKISGVQCLMESSSAGQSQYGLVIDGCGNSLSFENMQLSGTCTAPIHATPVDSLMDLS